MDPASRPLSTGNVRQPKPFAAAPHLHIQDVVAAPSLRGSRRRTTHLFRKTASRAERWPQAMSHCLQRDRPFPLGRLAPRPASKRRLLFSVASRAHLRCCFKSQCVDLGHCPCPIIRKAPGGAGCPSRAAPSTVTSATALVTDPMVLDTTTRNSGALLMPTARTQSTWFVVLGRVTPFDCHW